MMKKNPGVKEMPIDKAIQKKAINTIRFLSADGIQQANSGHPGLPMGAAAMAFTLWTRHLRFNPENPEWFGRDRFILSGGHGSMLLYSLLYLTGFQLSLDELRNFRQWGSLTPGHPEYRLTPGVEVTTGPLGQGFGNGVGMAIAADHLAAIFNKPGHEMIDHYIYAIVTDGDLMEGISSESASLAGHLKLGRLIYLYDDNRISIDGSTDIAFTEDRAKRFESYHWHVQQISDGNDVEAIDRAIQTAKEDDRPSIIMARTHIGYGLPTRQDTPKAHGEPPGEEELNGAKKNVDWPLEPRFLVPEDVFAFFREALERGKQEEKEWHTRLANYYIEYPDSAQEFERRIKGVLPEGWDSGLATFPWDEKGLASRAASGKVLNEIALKIPELIGGSADLAPSNKTWINQSPSFQPTSKEGRNFNFGVREHAMAAAVNGMAVHGGVIPYAGTFLVFSDYMRPAIRISALSNYPSIWVFTHDSIGVGEDGPTHQPVEQIAALRSIPNLVTLRPADANEVREAWKYAIAHRNGPTALIFSRQNLPTFNREVFAPADGLTHGAYVLCDLGQSQPEIILMASGSEVHLIVSAAQELSEEGFSVRVVSFPSWELFGQQEKSYRESVLPPNVKARLVVEAGVSMGWSRWFGDHGSILSVDQFGSSAPYKKIYQEYGLTTENIVSSAKALLATR
jgi:transketolase